ncbi:GDSL-type esterase/lipase family protein [Bacillus thuringiensis]|uniref:Lipase n=1 Tax=Bacillus thuringiensis serovar toumanoffi TaxID=180862 RepID=A0ABD5I4W2_BACTU|nr:GDSL-type esterase/lipase family protein [Bacillus thuringiensis]EEM94626.1 Lipase/acylhydrolase [Bacillus thuringiensis IBL 200]MCC6079095.1 GDSL-type esterase/lipase family protein [Bacillus thuringiensis]MCR6782158.1 GDSL-type esterase/lipase family protein [Bacillus thuringiensis]MCR6860228.1 GDSL-type esterase/lipase family protein [Bacillus thuringiensis]MCR6864552.1 GDSL-type esterase/lipase family protein [Bacillus thuringiensis]
MKKVILTIVCLLLLIISYSYFEKNDETKQNESEEKTSAPNWIDKQTNESFYHLVLGDSLAKGYGSTQGGFAELASKQIEAQIHKPIAVENLGVNGLTTDRLAKKVQSEDVKEKIRAANIITINIGGNNLFRLNRDVGVIDGIKMLNKEKAHFEADIKSIVKTVRDQNPDALLILSELYNPLQLDDSIASYADMFLDGWNESVYSISKANQPSIVLPIRKLISNDKKELLFDQVHPNDNGYAIIANTFTKQVLSYKY